MANEEKEEHFVYDFGGNENLSVIKSKRGYYCYGFVAGTTINVNGNDMKEIRTNLSDALQKAHDDYIKKANRAGAISLEVKDSELEETVKKYQALNIKMNKQGEKK